MGAWTTWASVSQTRTGSETKSARFSALTVNTNGKANETYRAIVTLTWMCNGHADGRVKASMDYYSVKWTVGIPTYVFYGNCTGTAD